MEFTPPDKSKAVTPLTPERRTKLDAKVKDILAALATQDIPPSRTVHYRPGMSPQTEIHYPDNEWSLHE